MHLSEEVVCQSSVVVESTKVCAAHIADLKLLVTRGTRRVGKSLELTFAVFFQLLLLSNAEVLCHGRVDTTQLAQDLNLNQTVLDIARQFANLFQESVRLANFVGGLFQAALGTVYAAVAVIDVFLHVSHVVELETPFALLLVVCVLVLGLQGFAVGLWTQAEILFGVGKQVVRTGADKVGAAHLWISDGELGSARCTGASQQLLAHELLCRNLLATFVHRLLHVKVYPAAFFAQRPWWRGATSQICSCGRRCDVWDEEAMLKVNAPYR